MDKASILCAGGALLLTLFNVIVGALTGLGHIGIGWHWRLAIPTVILSLAAWTVVVFYFIGAFAWARETLGDRVRNQPLLGEARHIRNAALPWICWAVLLLMAAYILGGGADTGAVPPAVHLSLALLALFFHMVAAYRTIVLVGMALDLQERIESGAGSGL